MKVLQELLIEKVKIFESSFKGLSSAIFYDEKKKRLNHPGEFGVYREEICRQFIRNFIPADFEIGTGFIITSTGEVSTQCDIIVYDAKNTPIIESSEQQRFFPVETVCAVGEIKSKLKEKNMKDALLKLSKIKMLREKIKSPVFIRNHKGFDDFKPKMFPYDNIFTFLICESFRFKKIPKFYNNEVPFHQWHNLILCIDDGIFLYKDRITNKSIMFPNFQAIMQKHRFIYPDKDKYIAFLFHLCIKYAKLI